MKFFYSLILFFSSGIMKRFDAIHDENIKNHGDVDLVSIDLPRVLPLIYLLFLLEMISILIFLGEIISQKLCDKIK